MMLVFCVTSQNVVLFSEHRTSSFTLFLHFSSAYISIGSPCEMGARREGEVSSFSIAESCQGSLMRVR